MHAIRRSDSLDHITCEKVRTLIEENTYELLDRTERRLSEVTQENIELVKELAQVYQDQIVWVENTDQLIQLIEAIQQKRDQSLVMTKIMRTDLNPYRIRIEENKGIFEQKITLFDRKLQILSSYEAPDEGGEPHREEIYQRHQDNVEQEVYELKTVVEKQQA